MLIYLVIKAGYYCECIMLIVQLKRHFEIAIRLQNRQEKGVESRVLKLPSNKNAGSRPAFCLKNCILHPIQTHGPDHFYMPKRFRF